MKTMIILISFNLILTSCGIQKPLKSGGDGISHTELETDSIYLQRIEVINSLFSNKKGSFNSKTGTYDKPELSKYFFQFRGLSAIIWNAEFVDNLLGHCVDFEEEKIFSYGEVFSEQEMIELKSQIGLFSKYRIIDEKLIHNSIDIVNDKNNTIPAVTFPLIVNNKAIIYTTNKRNFDVLLVLEKKDGNWNVICRKTLYLVIVD